MGAKGAGQRLTQPVPCVRLSSHMGSCVIHGPQVSHTISTGRVDVGVELSVRNIDPGLMELTGINCFYFCFVSLFLCPKLSLIFLPSPP